MAVIEAAIVLPVFFLLVLSIMEGGRMIYAYGVMSHAAREGARYAVVRGTEAGQDGRRAGDAPAIATQVATYVKNRVVLSPIRVFTTWPLDDGGQPNKNAGQVVEVRVEYDFNTILPELLPFSSITLTSTSRTVIYF